jgi:GcrA cell cycle regulator
MIFHDRYWEDGSKRTDTDFVHACRDHLSRKREEEIQKAGAKAARMTDLDQLAELWSEPGATLATIGDRLGLSRGQVAGKVDRARRLKGDLRFEPRPKPEPPGAAEPVVARLVVAAPPVPKNLLLVDTPWNGCRWPTGNAPDGRHLFCVQPQAPGRPYCAEHCGAVSPLPSSPSPAPRAPSPAGQRHDDEGE